MELNVQQLQESMTPPTIIATAPATAVVSYTCDHCHVALTTTEIAGHLDAIDPDSITPETQELRDLVDEWMCARCAEGPSHVTSPVISDGETVNTSPVAAANLPELPATPPVVELSLAEQLAVHQAKEKGLLEQIALSKAAAVAKTGTYVPLSAAEREATRTVVGEGLVAAKTGNSATNASVNTPAAPRYVPKIGGNAKTDAFLLALVREFVLARETYHASDVCKAKMAKAAAKAIAEGATPKVWTAKPYTDGFGAMAKEVHGRMNGKIAKTVQLDAIEGAIQRKILSDLTRVGMRLYFDASVRPQPAGRVTPSYDTTEMMDAFAGLV